MHRLAKERKGGAKWVRECTGKGVRGIGREVHFSFSLTQSFLIVLMKPKCIQYNLNETLYAHNAYHVCRY